MWLVFIIISWQLSVMRKMFGPLKSLVLLLLNQQFFQEMVLCVGDFGFDIVLLNV